MRSKNLLPMVLFFQRARAKNEAIQMFDVHLKTHHECLYAAALNGNLFIFTALDSQKYMKFLPRYEICRIGNLKSFHTSK